jgi:hypothetical protein
MLTVVIKGCNSVEKFRQVALLTATSELPLQINFPNLYLNYLDRAAASLAVSNLNQVEGLKAWIAEDQPVASTDRPTLQSHPKERRP